MPNNAQIIVNNGNVQAVITSPSPTVIVQSGIISAGGGGTPGGSDTQIQFNDSGVFGGDSRLTWDKIGGAFSLNADSIDITSSTTFNLSGPIVIGTGSSFKFGQSQSGITGFASFNIPSGVAPTTNLIDGDVWTASSHLFVRLGGVTYQLDQQSVGGGNPFADNTALVKNNADNTKLIILSAASISTATTRTLTAQDANYTIAGTSAILGGTGQNAVTTGDLLYGSAANTWSRLADVAVGSTLNSGGIGVAPGWSVVSNGLTATATTFKLGGALTADTNISGAFSLGIGVAPTGKLHVVGLGTTTGKILYLQNNTPSDRMFVLENGSFQNLITVPSSTSISKIDTTWTAGASGDYGFGFSGTITGRGTTSETYHGVLVNNIMTMGANTQSLSSFTFSGTLASSAFSGGSYYTSAFVGAPIGTSGVSLSHAGSFFSGGTTSSYYVASFYQSSGAISTATPMFRLRADGSFQVAGTAAFGMNNNIGNTPSLTGKHFWFFNQQTPDPSGVCFDFMGAITNPTSGDYGIFLITSGTFNPTSGTATASHTRFTWTLNQTSTASGALKILDIQPTYTSVLGNITGVDYNPAVTTVSGTHLSWRSTSGSMFLANSSSDTVTASTRLDIRGTGTTTGNTIRLASSANTTTFTLTDQGNFVHTQAVITSGSPTFGLFTGGAHTTLAAGTEAIDINFNLARTVQFASNTGIATQRAFYIQAPTYAFASATGTITTAATLYISGAPVAGTNAAITNPYAFYVNSGGVFFGGTTFVLGATRLDNHLSLSQSASGAPTTAGGTGAGTGPTISISGADSAGFVSVTTGTGPAASATIVTITFTGGAYSTAPKCIIISPANAATAALTGTTQVFADQANITTGQWVLTSGSAALAASTAYKWYYQVIQ